MDLLVRGLPSTPTAEVHAESAEKRRGGTAGRESWEQPGERWKLELGTGGPVLGKYTSTIVATHSQSETKFKERLMSPG